MFDKKNLLALDELEKVLNEGLDYIDKLKTKEMQSDHARLRKVTSTVSKMGVNFRKWSVSRCSEELKKTK